MFPDNQTNPQPGGVMPPQPPVAGLAPIPPVQPATFGPAPVAPTTADSFAAAPVPQQMNNPVGPAPMPAPQPVAMPVPPASQPMAAPQSQPGFAPQAPAGMFVGGVMPMQPGAMSMTSSALTSNDGGMKKRLVKVAIFGVVGIIVLGGLAFGGLMLLNSMSKVKYAAKDLTAIKTANYSVSYPKQWQDITSNNDAQEALFSKDFTTDKPDDLKVYAYGLHKDNKAAQSVVAVGSVEAGISDDDFKANIDQPGAKDQLEQIIKSAVSKDNTDSTCQSMNNKNDAFAYDTGNYLMRYTYSYDCVQSDAIQKATGTKQAHRVITMGLKNDRFYIMAFMTVDSDWIRNQAFYQNDMFPAYKPL